MDGQEKTERRSRLSAEQIRRILADYAASGQTQRAFCRERGLSLASFGNWRRRFGKVAGMDSGGGFCEVRLKEGGSETTVVIRLPDGIEVVLCGAVGPAQLAGYVAALRRLC